MNQMIRFGMKSQPPVGSPAPERIVCFYCRLVDPIERYQAGEVIVFESGRYFYCLMLLNEKREEEDEMVHESIDFTTTEAGRNLRATMQKQLEEFRDLVPARSAV